MLSPPLPLNTALVFLDKERCLHAGGMVRKGSPITLTNTNSRQCTTIKIGCPFSIHFSYIDVIPKTERPPDQMDKQLRRSDRLKITKVNGLHGPECMMNHQELQVVLRRTGVLSQFESGAIHSVVNQVLNDPKFGAGSIRHALKPFLPPGLELNAQDCCNFRIWCKKHASTLKAQGHNVTYNPSEIGTTIKEWGAEHPGSGCPSMDEAGEVLRGVLDAMMGDDGRMWAVQAYLEELKAKDPGFDYKIVRDRNGKAKGVVWQTPFMRSNMKKYGDCLFSGCMQEETQSSPLAIFWPCCT
jgi:hypothetical protein